MRVRPLLRAGGVVGAAALTLGVVAPVSHAEPTEVSFFDAGWGLGFDNTTTEHEPAELILLTGASVEERCADEYPTATVRARAKGDATAERLVDRGAFYVYEGGGRDFLDFTDDVCAAIASGGSAPTPVASGEGTLVTTVDLEFAGDELVSLSADFAAHGWVRTTDGDHWAVRGNTAITFLPEFDLESQQFTILNRR